MMDRPSRSIFRADAIRRYVSSREEVVLPRWISPRSFFCLWILLGLLLGGSFMAWLAKVPVYATGKAMVVGSRDRTKGVREKVVIAAFFPTQTLSQLQAHQPLLLHFQGISSLDRGRLSRLMLKDKPVIRSPEDIRNQFGLTASTALQINQPVAVAIASLAPSALDLPTSAYIGSMGKAEMVVGSQRLLSLLPWIGSHVRTP
jgi:hypothetical protein